MSLSEKTTEENMEHEKMEKQSKNSNMENQFLPYMSTGRRCRRSKRRRWVRAGSNDHKYKRSNKNKSTVNYHLHAIGSLS